MLTDRHHEIMLDAGMFHKSPYLRGELRRGMEKASEIGGIVLPRIFDDLIEQTAIVKMLDDMTADPGTSIQFEPLPIERFAFERVTAASEAVKLEDGSFMGYHTLLPAWQLGYLPEAASEEQVAILQAQCSPRLVTQWWLVPDNAVRKAAERHDIPMLYSDGMPSVWIPTYDEEPKDAFWGTSVGFCLLYLICKKLAE